ncbi:MAG: beta-ketoacyl-ACP synthase III [Planctomycetota bacterium]
MSDSPIAFRRCPTQRLCGVQIVGSGAFVPDNVVTNEDLARLGCDADWIIQRTGIRERRHAPADMSTGDMAAAAAERAIADAGVRRDEIDLLLLATFTPDYLLPQTASAVQDRLGLRCPAMDVVAACAGFMYALVTGAQFIGTGCAKRVLVVGADLNTRTLDPNDKKTYPLFGDGAGAVLLAPGGDDQGLLSYTLGADGSGQDLLIRPVGGVKTPFTPEVASGIDETTSAPWYMKMEGRPVFKWAVRLIEDSFNQVLADAGRDKEQVKLWLLHQANARILDAATDSFGIAPDRVVKHLDRYGNTSAGSIPIALAESLAEGKIARGDELMLCGFGAGLSWGTALWKW